MITVPAFGHDYYANACAPFLHNGQIVVLNPGSTGGALHFADKLRSLRKGSVPAVCETNTLTYICRLIEPAKVKITLTQNNVLFSSFPGNLNTRCAKIFSTVYPNIAPVKNVLITSLTNFNVIMHPAGMVMNAGWIEFTRGNFAYYSEGSTASICRVIEAVDKERALILERLGSSSLSFLEFFYQAGLTTKGAFETGSLYTAIQESEPDTFIRAPDSLDHRYLHEDIGYGIVPMVLIGEILGVKTPVMKSLLVLACLAANRDYMKTGLNLIKMGIDGFDQKSLLRYVNEGKV